MNRGLAVLARTSALAMVAVSMQWGGGGASAQELPRVYTPIGAFEVASVTLANEFPVGCRASSIPGVPNNCNVPRGNRRLLIIHVRNDAADRDGVDPIKDDINDIELVDERGAVWQLGLTQWSSMDGVRLVFTGPGSPATVVMTWPGNPPLTLETGSGT